MDKHAENLKAHITAMFGMPANIKDAFRTWVDSVEERLKVIDRIGEIHTALNNPHRDAEFYQAKAATNVPAQPAKPAEHSKPADKPNKSVEQAKPAAKK